MHVPTDNLFICLLILKQARGGTAVALNVTSMIFWRCRESDEYRICLVLCTSTWYFVLWCASFYLFFSLDGGHEPGGGNLTLLDTLLQVEPQLTQSPSLQPQTAWDATFGMENYVLRGVGPEGRTRSNSTVSAGSMGGLMALDGVPMASKVRL